MSKKINISCVLFLLFLGQQMYGQKSEEELIRQSFGNYKLAIFNNNGEEAVKYVDSRTIKYYSDILEMVKFADSTKIETLSILNKQLVFTLRHKISKEDLIRFDVNSLLVYSINSDILGKRSFQNYSVGEIFVENDSAKGEFIATGEKTTFFFEFYNEEGLWKIDLSPKYNESTDPLKKAIEESGKTLNEYLFSILELTTGKKPGKEIWQTIN